jgi:hypothetical protein
VNGSRIVMALSVETTIEFIVFSEEVGLDSNSSPSILHTGERNTSFCSIVFDITPTSANGDKIKE